MATFTWSGNVTLPTAGVTSTASGYVIAAGDIVSFAPGTTTTVSSNKSLIVLGELEMKPSSASVIHTLKFTGIVENNFGAGGGLFSGSSPPPAGDIGLYVLDAGKLDIVGSTRTPWTTVSGTLNAGATSLTVTTTPDSAAGTPVGWAAGQEIVIAPNEPITKASHWTHFEVRPIATIHATTGAITLGNKLGTSSPALSWAHNPVTVKSGTTMRAEVLNLSRNVIIQGTSATQRTHVFIQSTAPSTIKFCTIRWTGPRKTNVNPAGIGVKGRYGLHVHHSHNAMSGVTIEGVLIREGGYYGFITHDSHGITYKDCITYDVINHAYWWDPPEAKGDSSSNTNNITYDHCIAAWCKPDLTEKTGTAKNNTPVSGFFLATNGKNNRAIGCRAFGLAGSGKTSGFLWPEVTWSSGVGLDEPEWEITDCVVHNSQGIGEFLWQNQLGGEDTGTIIYYCQAGGVLFGAYNNVMHFTDTIVYGCGVAGFTLQVSSASSDLPDGPRLTNVYIDCPAAPYAVLSWEHTSNNPTQFLITNCTFKKAKTACFGCGKAGNKSPDKYKFVNCNFEGNEFWIVPTIHVNSLLTVENGTFKNPVTAAAFDPGKLEIRRAGQPGTPYPQWGPSGGAPSVTDVG